MKALIIVDGPVRLRSRLNNPAVLGARKNLVVDLAASRPVRRDEALLHGGEHIVVQFPLQDEHRRQGDRLAPFEDALRVGIDNGLPRVEIGLAVGDQRSTLHLLRLLIAGHGVADRRAGYDVSQGGVEVGCLRSGYTV